MRKNRKTFKRALNRSIYHFHADDVDDDEGGRFSNCAISSPTSWFRKAAEDEWVQAYATHVCQFTLTMNLALQPTEIDI